MLKVFKNSSPNFIRAIKSGIRCMKHVAHMGHGNPYTLWRKKNERKRPLEHLRVHERITLNGS